MTWEGLLQVSIWLGAHRPVVTLLTAAVVTLIAAVFFLLQRNVLRNEKWVGYFAWAFLFFAVQYFPSALGMWAERNGIPSDEFWANVVQWIRELAYPIGSPANNLCFLASALALLGQSRQSSRWAKSRFYPEILGILPPWSIAVGIATSAIAFAGGDNPSWHRLPDALFSAYCLWMVGWGLFFNFTPRRRPFLASFNLLGATLYGLLNLLYALNPFLAEGMLGEQLRQAIEQDPLSKPFLTPLTTLDALSFASAFLLKVLLFVAALLLIIRCLKLLSQENSGSALEQVAQGNLEYLSSEGLLKALGESVDADLAALCIRLPGLEAKQVSWRRWVSNPDWVRTSGHKRRRGLEVQAIPSPDKSNVAWVLRSGKTVKSSNFRKDPAIQDRYMKYAHGMKSLITVPIYYQGAIIAGLNLEWRKPRAFTATAVQCVIQMAEALAPTVHARRQLIAVEQFGRRLSQAADSREGGKGTLGELTKIVHDIVSPIATGVFLNIGFQRTFVVCNDNGCGNVDQSTAKVMVETVESLSKAAANPAKGAIKIRRERLNLGRVRIGRMALAVYEQKDEAERPTLVRDYLQRRAIASMIANAFVTAARVELSTILYDLQISLNSKETNSINAWHQIVRRASQSAGLPLVATLLSPADGGRLLSDSDEEKQIVEELRMELPRRHPSKLRLFSLEQRAEGQGGITAPVSVGASTIRNIIHLPLASSKASIWLGTTRPGFGPELEFESPWLVFLQRLADTADSSLVRIKNQRLMLDASKLELHATRTEITTLLMHELRDRAAEFSTGAARVQELLRSKGINDNSVAERVASLRQTASDFAEMASSLMRPIQLDNRVAIPLLEPVQLMKDRYEEFLKGRSIHLRSRVPARLLIKAPLTVAYLAIVNLVYNSAYAIKQRGIIRIVAEDRGETILCHVIDNGPGVDPKIRARLFEIGTTTKKEGGGWGLPLARSSLRRYGGDLKLAGTQKGKTIFTIYFVKYKGVSYEKKDNSGSREQSRASAGFARSL